jgi:hypothetical protein
MAEPKKRKDDKHESHGASKQRDHDKSPDHPKQKTTDPVRK